MAFTFAAFSYIVALIVDAFLIFFAIFHVSNIFCPLSSDMSWRPQLLIEPYYTQYVE